MKRERRPAKEDGKVGVRFRNVREIRMGSPYNLCEIALSGQWVPDLPQSDWQNIRTVNPDNGRLALVRWETTGNQPGFRVYAIDGAARRVWVSPRHRGCCEKLWWAGAHRVAWTAFPALEGSFDLNEGVAQT